MGSTTRFGSAAQRLLVKTLRADVLDGPDTGRLRVANSEELSLGTADANDLVLSDDTVSRFHLTLKRAEDGIRIVDQRSTNGTWIGAARLGEATVAPGTVVQLGRTRVRVTDGRDVDIDLYEGEALGPVRGRSAAMRRVMSWVERAARSDAPVLLVGESGTGKEAVARALHSSSARASKPLVTVDCGSLAPTLVASELFGHERGAFTGAERQHVGALEQADGGTLFLDEIGELPRELQSALLGALERRSFRRVGGRTEVQVDVRLVAATNRNLRAEVNAGTFRLDLFYRLAVLMLELPPLRDRRDDIPLLCAHFLSELGHDGSLETIFPPDRMEELASHSWPGNVRELRNVVQATLAIGRTPLISPFEASQTTSSASSVDLQPLYALPYKLARDRAIEEFDRRYLANLLTQTQDNVSQAARDAGLDRSYFFTLLRRAGLR
ncbi:MAG: sigma 54-dependent Fis family transcriptional regulator [Deltaproteobacteria bacterium]|nr:sigma 54-dependent Fis family transcriptional regulator [Deltaproteobacteria bacterium]